MRFGETSRRRIASPLPTGERLTMLALTSVWIGLLTCLLALLMLVYRPAFADVPIVLVLFFGSPGAMCLAGLVLWAHRKADESDPGVRGQRRQCVTAIVLAVMAAGIVYGLIIFSQKIVPVEDSAALVYNSRREGSKGFFFCNHANSTERTTPKPFGKP